jgi:hypothetical protein
VFKTSIFVTVLVALSANVALAATDNMTSVKNEHFALELPGSWFPVRTDGASFWQYSNEGQNEAISVSVLKPLDVSTADQRRNRLIVYLSARLKSEHDVAPSAQIEKSVTKTESERNGVVASYVGYQPDTGRRFAALAIINAHQLVCFYLETFGLTVSDFKKREKSLLGAVQIAD